LGGCDVFRRAGSRILGEVVVVLAGLLLTACSNPVAVGQSNKAGDYNQKLKRVLVAMNLQSSGMTDTNKNALIRPEELRKSFNTKWVPLGLSVEVVDLGAAPNKSEAMGAAIAAANPTQAMELKTTSYTTTSYVLDGYSVSANLYDPRTKKVVWRTVVEFKPFSAAGRLRNGPMGSPISHQDDANELVDALTVKLKSDGLL
jgi:hypothetical protein